MSLYRLGNKLVKRDDKLAKDVACCCLIGCDCCGTKPTRALVQIDQIIQTPPSEGLCDICTPFNFSYDLSIFKLTDCWYVGRKCFTRDEEACLFTTDPPPGKPAETFSETLYGYMEVSLQILACPDGTTAPGDTPGVDPPKVLVRSSVFLTQVTDSNPSYFECSGNTIAVLGWLREKWVDITAGIINCTLEASGNHYYGNPGDPPVVGDLCTYPSYVNVQYS